MIPANIPEKTTIYNSRLWKLLLMLCGSCFLCLGFYLLITESFFGGLLFGIPSAYSIYQNFKTYKDKEKKLEITDKGLWSKKYGFRNWNQIKDEHLENVPNMTSSWHDENYLTYLNGRSKERIDLNDLGIGNSELLILVRVYRQRGVNGTNFSKSK